ncbi:stage III sporulation protein AG [Clostridium botulinum]|uniref:Stage III sporulation protein AG n=2 Tax=Clostridium botulinum TaxID=1491 RepID=A0A846I709_CLOBO|nr:stage III sporulation protein AG [Clostridium botulinum]AJD27576.1 stage III sporulation protein AG [Clostridium botulinum CDC_297]ACQ54050.1 stage III sporulation protein AG [Clostridium botulinum Ba4 str. 657]AJE12059.1 stage III sporulation protein AG [Clostridium botulinum CDC_1436]APQ99526.1 stage III sporulation protein AG [Clostridium botulinum]APU60788.1 stage III sporulation protein AG [Clostridium botulinum]
MDIKNWLKKLETNPKNNKKNMNILIVVLVGVLFLIAGSTLKKDSVMSKNENPKNKQTQEEKIEVKNDDYEKETQNKLKATLEKIDGVGKVEVMITFESGEEKVPAVNINNSTNKSVEKDTEGGTRNTTQENEGSSVVVTNDGDKTQPLIVKEYKPKITGVCIVAEGAENNITKLRISKAVVDLFSLAENKVNVYPMKK